MRETAESALADRLATTVSVRPAVPGDLPAVSAIYRTYVESSVISFEVEPPSPARWQERFDLVAARGLPFLVALSGIEVVGYAYAAPWKERVAYRFTVENTVYLAPSARGHSVGRVLLDALLAACAAAGVHQVIAVIADSGEPDSVRLHARCGFRTAGRLERVGFKHDRWIDTVLMQRELPDPRPPGEAARTSAGEPDRR